MRLVDCTIGWVCFVEMRVLGFGGLLFHRVPFIKSVLTGLRIGLCCWHQNRLGWGGRATQEKILDATHFRPKLSKAQRLWSRVWQDLAISELLS